MAKREKTYHGCARHPGTITFGERLIVMISGWPTELCGTVEGPKEEAKDCVQSASAVAAARAKRGLPEDQQQVTHLGCHVMTPNPEYRISLDETYSIKI